MRGRKNLVGEYRDEEERERKVEGAGLLQSRGLFIIATLGLLKKYASVGIYLIEFGNIFCPIGYIC